MSKTKKKLFSVAFVNFGSILNDYMTDHLDYYFDYRYLRNCPEPWYCKKRCNTIFPFNSLSSNKNFLPCCTNTDSNITQWKDLENDHHSSLLLKPSSNLELFVNQFSKATPENDYEPEKIASSKYYDIDEMHNI